MSEEKKASTSDWRYEHEMRVWVATLSWRSILFSTHSSFLASLSSLALNSVILANGAAAAAILALLGSMWGKPEIDVVLQPALKSLSIFAGGVFAATLAAGLGYVGQYGYAAVDLWTQEGSTWQKFARVVAVVFHILSVLFTIVAIGSFGWGAWEGLRALSETRGGSQCVDLFGLYLCSK